MADELDLRRGARAAVPRVRRLVRRTLLLQGRIRQEAERMTRPNRGWGVRMAPKGSAPWLWWHVHTYRESAWTEALESWDFALNEAGLRFASREQRIKWLKRHRGVSVVRVELRCVEGDSR